jgi:hypothetical protein
MRCQLRGCVPVLRSADRGVTNRKLHNDTALSLDGNAPTGHSVGQHV